MSSPGFIWSQSRPPRVGESVTWAAPEALYAIGLNWYKNSPFGFPVGVAWRIAAVRLEEIGGLSTPKYWLVSLCPRGAPQQHSQWYYLGRLVSAPRCRQKELER